MPNSPLHSCHHPPPPPSLTSLHSSLTPPFKSESGQPIKLVGSWTRRKPHSSQHPTLSLAKTLSVQQPHPPPLTREIGLKPDPCISRSTWVSDSLLTPPVSNRTPESHHHPLFRASYELGLVHKSRAMVTDAAQAEYDSLFNNPHRSIRTHPEDSPADKDQSDLSSNDGSTTLHSADESSHTPPRASSPMTAATYLPNTTQFDANTGPKGVIADARSFENARKRSFRQTLYAFAESAPFKRLNVANREKSKSPSPDLSTDEDEDDFMRQWRQKRIDELSNMKQEIRTRRLSPSKRRYGSLVPVDPAGYLDAVEKVSAETVVVVLIYDDQVSYTPPVPDRIGLDCSPSVRPLHLYLHGIKGWDSADGILV